MISPTPWVATLWCGLPNRQTPARPLLLSAAGFALVLLAALAGLAYWIGTLAFVAPSGVEISKIVVDREGRLLYALTVADGRWRLPVEIDEVDPLFF